LIDADESFLQEVGLREVGSALSVAEQDLERPSVKILATAADAAQENLRN
jgi:hypothetical protein